jgi:hypothetical protein
MSERESDVKPETESTLPVVRQTRVHLVATNPTQMEESRRDLHQWLITKVESLDTDITDFNKAITTARENKWNVSGLSRLRNKAVDTQKFYAKILEAVTAGFVIVPDFPVDVFAIRVDGEMPREQIDTASSKWGLRTMTEGADILPVGAGHYVSPLPEVVTYTESGPPDAEQKPTKRWVRETTSFNDVVFPVRAARVEVMAATAQAMALKLFDQIGICPPRRNPDPLIIGQICIPIRSGEKRCSFMIAWHLNLNEL